MPNSEGVQEFLESVERLLKECDRRKNTDDLTVIAYMLRRIKSSKSALTSIKTGYSLGIPEAQEFDYSDIENLVTCFESIEDHWVQKKDSVASMDIDNDDEHPYLTPNISTEGKVGRPRYLVDGSRVAELKHMGFTDALVATILGVSRTTLWRRCGPLRQFSTISDDDLDDKVTEIKREHSLIGERLLDGMLIAENLKIPRRRLRESIHRVDPINTALRWMRRNPRWVYSVPGPNSLWHNDGLHKMIRWGFVVHACIDGYSRMITSLIVATNNLASTTLAGFISGVERLGLPERVRGDNGTENNHIEEYMFRTRGGGHISGDLPYITNASSDYTMIPHILYCINSWSFLDI